MKFSLLKVIFSFSLFLNISWMGSGNALNFNNNEIKISNKTNNNEIIYLNYISNFLSKNIKLDFKINENKDLLLNYLYTKIPKKINIENIDTTDYDFSLVKLNITNPKDKFYTTDSLIFCYIQYKKNNEIKVIVLNFSKKNNYPNNNSNNNSNNNEIIIFPIIILILIILAIVLFIYWPKIKKIIKKILIHSKER